MKLLKQGGHPLVLLFCIIQPSPEKLQAYISVVALVFQFVDMMGWHLETADRADIPVSFNPGSSSVVADLQELPSTVHSASWVAPLSYLGDKVTASCCPSEPLPGLLHQCENH